MRSTAALCCCLALGVLAQSPTAEGLLPPWGLAAKKVRAALAGDPVVTTTPLTASPGGSNLTLTVDVGPCKPPPPKGSTCPNAKKAVALATLLPASTTPGFGPPVRGR